MTEAPQKGTHFFCPKIEYISGGYLSVRKALGEDRSEANPVLDFKDHGAFEARDEGVQSWPG